MLMESRRQMHQPGLHEIKSQVPDTGELKMEGILQALTGFQTPKTRAEKEWETKLMTCRHCGKQSTDRNEVSTFLTHVGGQGEVWVEECANDISGCCERAGL